MGKNTVARFFLVQKTKTGIIYQNCHQLALKYTKMPLKYVYNGHELYIQKFGTQGLPKFPDIDI
jgi:hypothetical protein